MKNKILMKACKFSNECPLKKCLHLKIHVKNVNCSYGSDFLDEKGRCPPCTEIDDFLDKNEMEIL